LMLTGTNCNIGLEKNNKELSSQRAENIKNYLTDVWGINPDRIKVTARNLPVIPSNNKDVDGQAENRRVEISSSDLDITAPLFIVDTLLKVRPDAIRYLPKVNSEAGLSKWDLVSSSGGVELKRFSGSNIIDDNTNWNLSNEGSLKRQLLGSLKTKFSAIDKQNNVREISLNHPVKIISVKDKRLNATRDTSLNVYNLILFDFNKSNLNQSNKQITDFITSEITPHTDVTIFGFTDRIGDADYNMKLSTSRAESTGKALGGHPYKVTGMGESKLIYDNELPEGRFYCRTVIVEAKVPIN
jgi:outer membrane protein OmpA-like peptidoglycan-associated protein